MLRYNSTVIQTNYLRTRGYSEYVRYNPYLSGPRRQGADTHTSNICNSLENKEEQRKEKSQVQYQMESSDISKSEC